MAQRQILLLRFECKAEKPRKRAKSPIVKCLPPVHKTITQSLCRFNRRQCHQPTPVPSNDGCASFGFINTCRAAKSETPAAPVDAVGTCTSCTLTVGARTTIS